MAEADLIAICMDRTGDLGIIQVEVLSFAGDLAHWNKAKIPNTETGVTVGCSAMGIVAMVADSGSVDLQGDGVLSLEEHRSMHGFVAMRPFGRLLLPHQIILGEESLTIDVFQSAGCCRLAGLIPPPGSRPE